MTKREETMLEMLNAFLAEDWRDLAVLSMGFNGMNLAQIGWELGISKQAIFKRVEKLRAQDTMAGRLTKHIFRTSRVKKQMYLFRSCDSIDDDGNVRWWSRRDMIPKDNAKWGKAVFSSLRKTKVNEIPDDIYWDYFRS